MTTENDVPSVDPVDPPHDVVQLVDRFKKHVESYRSPEYLETRLRREFLDPFFAALGWDVDNRSGYAEAYKEVIHEDSIKVPGRDGGTKAPDYCFRIGGARKFFVEAKKPSVNIRTDADPAYQLRRYAWSAKLPLSLLTDFEELAIYDCRLKPGPRDASSVARTALFTVDEYLDPGVWSQLASIFSKDAILKGSFDRYVDSAKRKRGTAEVDDALLDEIENWRELLAKAIAKRNPQLNAYQLNHVVQATIDRIMFLRIAEDRGIEPYGTLLALTNGDATYKRLFERFRLADQRYNSGLFHFEEERGRTGAPDDIASDLQIDDKPLKQILKGLYYPESPYEFSVFAPEILGQVYEQFLGKVIRLTPSGLAKIEEKPEVKKAGGVFYTPSYIVDYIVEQAVGGQLQDKTVEDLGPTTRASKPQAAPAKTAFTILDPACGSGGFLLRAYDFLLDWYRAKYTESDPEKFASGKHPRLYLKGKADWRLTTSERKRILTTHIYGVDIDPQACEVTKLSLLLKVLEGESDETIGANLRLFHERALPDLSHNIKCGNTLIAPDYYQPQQLALLDDNSRLRVNAFDWTAEFSDVFRSGGFDAVIGNPPYVLLQWFESEDSQAYLRNRYAVARYKLDTYHLFIERGVELCRPGGVFGYITPSSFLRNKFARDLRQYILENTNPRTLRVFQYPVFRGASVDTCILVADRAPPDSAAHVEVQQSPARDAVASVNRVSLNDWRSHLAFEFSVSTGRSSSPISSRFASRAFALGNVCDAYFGIQTHDRSRYVSTDCRSEQSRPVIDGGNIARFDLAPPTEYVDFSPEAIKSGGKPAIYVQKRIGVRQIGRVPVATIVPADIFTLNTIYNVYFREPSDYRLEYLLGVMLSKASQWYWINNHFDQKKTFPKIKKAALLDIPIPTVDFANAAQRQQHDDVAATVDAILDMNRRRLDARTGHERDLNARQRMAAEKRLDELVFAMYGFTVEEVATIEASVAAIG